MTAPSENFKCAFSSPLIGASFGCAQAEPVAGRGGPDVACRSRAAHERCARLFERLKAAALPAFGVEDDLLSMPHSVLVKIQYGGLLGLQRLLDEAAGESVADIEALVARAETRHQAIESVPAETLVSAMTGYQLRRRRG